MSRVLKYYSYCKEVREDWTLYEERLSMVSCQRVKQVPRSASRICILRLLRDLVSPWSISTTGIPV